MSGPPSLTISLLYVGSAAGNEAEEPADGCNDQQDQADPKQPADRLRESANEQKDDCHNACDDQKSVHSLTFLTRAGPPASANPLRCIPFSVRL